MTALAVLRVIYHENLVNPFSLSSDRKPLPVENDELMSFASRKRSRASRMPNRMTTDGKLNIQSRTSPTSVK